jgi:hypothetical protein
MSKIFHKVLCQLSRIGFPIFLTIAVLFGIFLFYQRDSTLISSTISFTDSIARTIALSCVIIGVGTWILQNRHKVFYIIRAINYNVLFYARKSGIMALIFIVTIPKIIMYFLRKLRILFNLTIEKVKTLSQENHKVVSNIKKLNIKRYKILSQENAKIISQLQAEDKFKKVVYSVLDSIVINIIYIFMFSLFAGCIIYLSTILSLSTESVVVIILSYLLVELRMLLYKNIFNEIPTYDIKKTWRSWPTIGMILSTPLALAYYYLRFKDISILGSKGRIIILALVKYNLLNPYWIRSKGEKKQYDDGLGGLRFNDARYKTPKLLEFGQPSPLKTKFKKVSSLIKVKYDSYFLNTLEHSQQTP